MLATLATATETVIPAPPPFLPPLPPFDAACGFWPPQPASASSTARAVKPINQERLNIQVLSRRGCNLDAGTCTIYEYGRFARGENKLLPFERIKRGRLGATARLLRRGPHESIFSRSLGSRRHH